jgi:hypothetical protein
MKKTLASLLSILLPAVSCPRLSFAAEKPLKNYLNPQEQALWHITNFPEGAKCGLEDKVDDAGYGKCREALGKAAEQYLREADGLEKTKLVPVERTYIANHPKLAGTKGRANLEKLFGADGTASCKKAEDSEAIVLGLRDLLRRDFFAYREGTPGGAFSGTVQKEFPRAKDCETARKEVEDSNDDLYSAFINDNFSGMDSALLITKYPGDKIQEFHAKGREASIRGRAASGKFVAQTQKELKEFARASSQTLPAISEKAPSVREMLSQKDLAFLDEALTEEQKKVFDARIKDADKKLQANDPKPAIELAKGLRKIVSSSLLSYADDQTPEGAEAQLQRLKKAMDVALNPNLSDEDRLANIGKVLDGSKPSDQVVENAPGETDSNANNGLGKTPPMTEPKKPKGNMVVAAPNKKLDESAKDGAAAAKKKKRLLKRAAIGAAYGAVGLGFIGFVFGGPIGALVAGLAGAAIVGGMVHMVNTGWVNR